MADKSIVGRLTDLHERGLDRRRKGSAVVSILTSDAIDLAFDAMAEIDRLRAAMGSEGQQFMQALVDEASAEKVKRKAAEDELVRLRMERDGLRFKVRARDLLDQQLAEEMAEMQRSFSSRGEHGGSPGEWSYERMDEIATEQQRRAARTTGGAGPVGGDHGR